MRITSRILVFAVVCLATTSPRATALNIIFEPLSATTHPQILDGTFNFDAENPAFDANATGLLNILQQTEAVYEDAFEDADTIRITYWWDADMPFCCGQSIPSMMREDGNGNLTHAVVRFNPTVAYYIDPTPANDSEYTMDQVLYNFGPNALTPTQQTQRFTGNVPNVFEAGYNGAVVPGGPADGGLRDLLTLAFQEVGHSLGLNAGFTGVTNGSMTGEGDDGDYDVNPNFVNGNVMAMLPRGGAQDPLDHLFGNDAVMASLSISSERTRPSAADFFAIASTQGWTQIDLPRQDFLGGNDWNTGFNWMGGQVPLSLDSAYVRHGAAVTLSGIGNVSNLLVDNNSSVQTSTNTLVADLVTIQKTVGAGTPRILVSEFGELLSDVITVDSGARLDVFGGDVEFERMRILNGGELRGNGTIDGTNIVGEITNDGTIRASGAGTLLITSLNNLGIDLDGNDENGEVVVTVADLDIQTGLSDSFNGTATVGGGRRLTFGSGASVGAGGLLLLDGSADPATVDGSVLFISSSGVLRADGLGVVENPLILTSGSISETADAAAELRFNGSTYFNGGRVVGPGLARQNGPLFVGQDSEVEVNTYDLDGLTGNTVVTISAGSTLLISSTFIDTTADNDFDGAIHVNGSTLDIESVWQLDGTLNLNGQDMGGGGSHEGASDEGDGIASLHGAGGVVVDNGGRINIVGTAFVETAATVINGLVFVDGIGEFSGPTSLGVNANVEINNANDSLRLRGTTTLVGPSLVGSGRLIFEDNVNVAFVNTSVGTAETDLDGLLGNTQVLINSGLTFSIASITIEPTPNDGFDGVVTNRGTFSVLAGWRLDGDLEMEQIGGNVPTLAGLGTFRIHTTGTFSSDGDAIVNPPTQVAGAMLIDGGVTQINNTASFESTAIVMVDAGAELELNGVSTLSGGSYSGGGLIQFNALTNVNANTTIATGRVDLDGAAENTQISLNNAALVLNVGGIDVTNNLYVGTMNVTGAAARLEVNLSNPLTAWRVTSGGVLNFSTPSAGPVTMLDGSDLSAEGIINATGRVRLEANITLRSRLNVLTSDTDVHFGSGGQNFMFNTGSVAGLGSITIDDGTRMHLENNTNVGVDVENAGRLEVGFVASEVAIDLTAPGSALIRANFSQTSTGTFAVNLAGLLQGSQFDLLNVTQTARLGGTLEISTIDGFVPTIGNTFQILTAASVVNTFATVYAFDEADLLGYGVTVLYSPTDVVVRIDNVFLLGDYNMNGIVDAADYTVWRNMLGQMGAGLAADGNGDSVVDANDYAVWKSHFGNMSPGSGSSSIGGSPAVPEPSCLLLAALGGLISWTLAYRPVNSRCR
jgi:hypothetical protein